MFPKVSVIIPVYNVQEYLGQCLDTVLLQTLQDIEVICVDDGSTDDGLSILNTYAMLDERIRVIHQENKGLGPARNRGLKEATGEFIIFLDSDDFFHPEMLAAMVSKAEEDGSDIAICGHLLFDDKSGKDYWDEKIGNKYLAASPISPKDYSTDLFSICSASACTKLFRHDFLRKNDLAFVNVYAEDVPFSYTAMVLANKISLLEECFYHYRQNRNGQITENRHKKHGANIFLPLTELYNNLKRFNLKDTFLKAYEMRFKKMLTWELKGRSPVERRDFLNQFIKNLPSEIAELVFGYGNHQNKISIIIAVYNAAPFLCECLDSCLSQTLKEIEIICVDDGSTDNSLNILKEYEKKDDRVKILSQENQRQSIARYNAMKVATGEYVWYVDADDYLDLDSCECLYLYAKIYKLDMLSFACIDFQNGTGLEQEEPYHALKWLPENFTPVFTWKNVCNIVPQLAVTAPLTIYRREFLENNDIHWIHKKIVYEDTPFFTEAMLKDATMGAFPERFYHKRVHKEATTQNMDTNFSDYCWIVEYTFELVKKLSSDSELWSVFINGYLTKVYLNYQKLSPEIQKKMIPHFYKLLYHVTKKYHIIFSDEINKICYDYLKTKSIEKRLIFWYFLLLSKWAISGYTICPFNIHFKPNLTLSVFGLPLIKFKKKIVNYDNIFNKVINGHFKDTNIQISDIFKDKTVICDQKIHAPYLHILWKEKLVDFNQYMMDFKVALVWGYSHRLPQPEMVSCAIKKNIPIVFVEDGFIRSADTWAHSSVESKYTSGISFTFSNTVPYFDATRPSLLEKMLNDKRLTISEKQRKRARKCIDFIVENHLTKYNHQPIYTPNIGRKGVQKVLVVDQSYEDFSISKGLANNNTFKIMLEKAIKENPNADIIIKTHPDSIAPGTSHPRGYYSGYQSHDNIYLLTTPINPISLLKYCDKVYTVTSQFGFEALMCGKEVHTFGMPFYAGWGLTQDYLKCHRRKNKRTLDEMFYIVYILYSYYVNPKTQKACEIEEAMGYLIKLRDEYFKKFNIGSKKYYLIGVSHPTCGIMAIWKNTVSHILYAEEHGLIPVVDLQHFQNQYFKDDRAFKDNVWEYFFEQPTKYKLDDLKDEKNIILSKNTLISEEKYAVYDSILPNTKKDIPINIPLLLQKYHSHLIFNEKMKLFLQKQQISICPEKNVLGILCRGTDYLHKKPKNHPIQPDPSVVLEKAKDLLDEHSYDRIYLATEDAEIYRMFKNEFGELLATNSQYLYENTADCFLSEVHTKRENHSFQLAMEYLSSLYILSQCRHFIGGQTAGTIAVYFLSNFFEKQDYIYIWKLGHYE